MAEFPDYRSQREPPSGPGILVQPRPGIGMPALDFGGGEVASATVAAGKEVAKVGEQIATSQDRTRANEAMTGFITRAADIETRYARDPNYQTAAPRMREELDTLRKGQLESIQDPVRRSVAEHSMVAHGISATKRVEHLGLAREADANRASLDVAQSAAISDAISAGSPVERQAVIDRYLGQVQGTADGLWIGKDEAVVRGQGFIRQLSSAQALNDIRENPERAQEHLRDPKNYPLLTPIELEHYRNAAQTSADQLKIDRIGELAKTDPEAARRVVSGLPANPPGMIQSGNINLATRPTVKNADGTISTVRSISVNIDGAEVLIPTVSNDGRILSNEDAIAEYKRTGQHLGKFDTPAHASQFAEQVHQQQAANALGLSPHNVFRAREVIDHVVKQQDAQAKHDATVAASTNRHADPLIELIKEGADVDPVRVQTALATNDAAAARGDEASRKYASDLRTQMELQPFVRQAWSLSPVALDTAVKSMRAELTKEGANPTAAQFTALHAFQAVAKEQADKRNEEPVLLGGESGARIYKLQPIDVKGAAADTSIAAGLVMRGQHALAAQQHFGGSGSPFTKQEIVIEKDRWEKAGPLERFQTLQTLSKTMPPTVYEAAVKQVAGPQFGNPLFQRLVTDHPEIAQEAIHGAAILSEKNVSEKAQVVRAELDRVLGGQIYPTADQQEQAVRAALYVDAARRAARGTLYDQADVSGLQRAWDDVNGPLVKINGVRTPVTPGIPQHVFTDALRRIDKEDLARMGGARDRTGRALEPSDIGYSVLKPQAPGSEFYFVGMKDARAPDGFAPLLDANGGPLVFDMRAIAARHQAQAPAGPTPHLARRRTMEKAMREATDASQTRPPPSPAPMQTPPIDIQE